MKRFKKGLVAVICIVMAFAFVGCKKPAPTPTDETDEKETIVLNKNNVELDVYDELLLVAQYAGESSIAWSSSDDTIASVDGGKVSAKKAGRAVIEVSAGDVSASCNVVVLSSGLLPQITLNVPSDKINILAGDEFDLKAAIEFNGKVYTDGSFSFEKTGDSLSITENGKITAIKNGTSTVTVKSDWKDFSKSNLFRQIEINVVSDGSITLSKSEIEVYTKAKNEFSKTDTVSATVKINNQAATGGTLSWHKVAIGDDNIESATIDNSGLVTAGKFGTVHIYAQYDSPEHGIIVSPMIKVNAKRLLNDETSKEKLVFDYTEGATIFGSDIGKSTDVEEVRDTDTGKAFKFDAESGLVSGTQIGNQQWDIVVDDEIYRYNVLVATKLIKTGSDLANIYAMGSRGDASKGYAYGGYFVLNNDIDASGIVMQSKGMQDNSSTTLGFQGEFHGNGHTISNLTTADAGVFAHISEKAIVKDVAFENINLVARASGWAAVLAYSISGGIAENIYVSTSSPYVCTIIQTNRASTMKNFVVYGDNFAVNPICINEVDGHPEDMSTVFGISNKATGAKAGTGNHFDIKSYKNDDNFKAIDFSDKFKYSQNTMWETGSTSLLPQFIKDAQGTIDVSTINILPSDCTDYSLPKFADALKADSYAVTYELYDGLGKEKLTDAATYTFDTNAGYYKYRAVAVKNDERLVYNRTIKILSLNNILCPISDASSYEYVGETADGSDVKKQAYLIKSNPASEDSQKLIINASDLKALFAGGVTKLKVSLLSKDTAGQFLKAIDVKDGDADDIFSYDKNAWSETEITLSNTITRGLLLRFVNTTYFNIEYIS